NIVRILGRGVVVVGSGNCQVYPEPSDYVADCYTVETYRRVYNPAILPMSHVALWSESCIIPPLPSNFRRDAGRPPKARRRESDEPTLKNKKKSKKKQVQKLRRHQTIIHCRTCGEPGHNTTKCPERVPFPTKEMPEARSNTQGPSTNTEDTSTDTRTSKRKKKVLEVAINTDGPSVRETQGVTILPPLPPEEDPMDEPTVDPCITQQESQLVAAPVYKKDPSMHQQLQQSNQHLTLQPRIQIRASPPMIGSQRLPVFFNTSRAPQGNRAAIIRDGGQKFLDLNQISSLG
ncbi:UNVERIFIED_CONTAM: hypothetical protein Sindi_2882400, partial [Sesamum indicum]